MKYLIRFFILCLAIVSLIPFAFVCMLHSLIHFDFRGADILQRLSDDVVAIVLYNKRKF